MPPRRRRTLAAPLIATLAAACAMISPEPAPTGGTLEKVVVHGESLEGALAGWSADREVFVYLPPSYATSLRRRYPVLVSLHGFGATGEAWATDRLGAPELFDRAIAAGGREMIVVMPDAQTPLGGVMFSSSATTGDWESFIADDLVAWVDAHYRTIATPEARGLSGFSMGGYGTLRIAMKRPEVFGAVYAMSSCCLSPVISPAPAPGALDGFADLEAISSYEEAAGLGFGAAPLAMAAAWSPDPSKPPLYIDLPTENGEPQPDVIAAWAANAPLVMIHQHVPALKSIGAIGVEIGLQDSLLADNARLHEALDAYGVAHVYETYEGGHGDRLRERMETRVLPFFSEHLK